MPPSQDVKEIWQVTRISGDHVQVESIPSGFCPCSRCCCGKMKELKEEAFSARAELKVALDRMDAVRVSLNETSHEESYMTARGRNGMESVHSDGSGILDLSSHDREESPTGSKIPEAQVNAVVRHPISKKTVALNKSTTLSSTILHASTVRKNAKFECPQCEKKYVKRGNLNRHLLTHVQPIALGPQAAQSTRSKRARKAASPNQQVPAVVKEQAQGYSCEICQKTVRNKRGLASHKRGKAHQKAAAAAADAAAAQMVQVQAQNDLQSSGSGETFEEVTHNDDVFEYSIYPTNEDWTTAETDSSRASAGNPSNGLEVAGKDEVVGTGVTYARLRIHVRMGSEKEVVDLTGDDSEEDSDLHDVKVPVSSEASSISSSLETSEAGASNTSTSLPLADTCTSEELAETSSRPSGVRRDNLGRPAVSHRPFECPACSSRFESAKARNAHIDSHRDRNRQFSCNLCVGDSFGPWKEFAEYACHVMQLHRSPIFTCLQCQSRFSTSARLQQHQRAMHPDEKPVAPNSGSAQQNPPRLFAVTPARDRYKQAFQTCSWCSKKCRSSNSLQLHVQQMHSSQVFQYQPTSASASSNEAKRQSFFQCTTCCKSYINRECLNKHIESRHRGSSKMVQGKDRLRYFSVKRAHSGERSFKCSECPLRLSSKGSLALHKKVHSGEKRFMCMTCPQRFSTKQGLDTHHRIHSGEQPYECSVCRRRFSQRSSMVTHRLRIHPMKV